VKCATAWLTEILITIPVDESLDRRVVGRRLAPRDRNRPPAGSAVVSRIGSMATYRDAASSASSLTSPQRPHCMSPS